MRETDSTTWDEHLAQIDARRSNFPFALWLGAALLLMVLAVAMVIAFVVLGLFVKTWHAGAKAQERVPPHAARGAVQRTQPGWQDPFAERHQKMARQMEQNHQRAAERMDALRAQQRQFMDRTRQRQMEFRNRIH